MATTAIAAYGTLLKRGDGGGPEAFTTVAEVTKIDLGGVKLDVVEATHNPVSSTFTVTGTSTTFTLPSGVLLRVGQVIRVSSATTLPGGLAANTDYYVLTFSAPNATISASPGGSAITFSDTGTGTHTAIINTAWRDQVPTLKDGGELTLDLNFDPQDNTQDGTAGLLLDCKNGTKRNFELYMGAADPWEFAAYVTGFKPSAPVDGKLASTVTLKFTGDPTLT